MPDSTFRIPIRIGLKVWIEGSLRTREEFYSWAWAHLEPCGLAGIHEGTILAESWTVDAGEAPPDRDWLKDRAEAEAQFYFRSTEGAAQALAILARVKGLELGPVEEEKPQDWDAQWKASFTGASVAPFWRVLPPWITAEKARLDPGELILRINPGAGFGTGTHETTQLCLRAIGEIARRKSIAGVPVLDFGSGSGILSIAAALLGAQVQGVEIDGLAVDNAMENARLNGVDSRVVFSKTLASASGRFPLVIANILRPVLLEFSRELVKRIAPGGSLVLSGLIDRDVDEVVSVFGELREGRKPEVRELGEWRCLVWSEDLS